MRLEARLRAFAAYVRLRSFSGAARELRISQPAVSKHIADIEREFGAPLVERRRPAGAFGPAAAFRAHHALREEGSATRGVVEAAFADLGITPKRRLELPSWEAIKLMARRGYGVAACGRFAVEEELRSGLLAVIPIRGWKARSTMSVLRVRD